MKRNGTSNIKKKNVINCEDIYRKEFRKELVELKIAKKGFSEERFKNKVSMFNIVDANFYSYKGIVSVFDGRQKELIVRIILEVLDRYNIVFERTESDARSLLDFYLIENNKKIGVAIMNHMPWTYGEAIKKDGVEYVYIVRTEYDSHLEDLGKRDIEEWKKQYGIETILVKDFFEKFFNKEEYIIFNRYLEDYIKDAREIIGFDSVQFLSRDNLGMLKKQSEKDLLQGDFSNCKYYYSIIDNDEEDWEYKLIKDEINNELLYKMQDNYLNSEKYKTLLGGNDYAESFITSEWLLSLMKNKKRFDYTSIINGYLKSVEQLMY